VLETDAPLITAASAAAYSNRVFWTFGQPCANIDCRGLPTDILILVVGMIFEFREFASRTLDKQPANFEAALRILLSIM
jgi:hypothetical protein